MEDKISIIMPVYNVEKYLTRCLESVINQTYKNLQIILVDDGSTDKSGLICDTYAKSDERIVVIHQANQGAGAAKNAGLEAVEGDYFLLIDSDDYIELDMCEKMLNAMKKYSADIVQCLFKRIYVNKEYSTDYCFNSDKNVRSLSNKRFLFEMIYDWKYTVFWNKLFKASLIDKSIRFPTGRKIDDEYFTYKLVCNAKKVININDMFYNYRMRTSSVMNESSQSKLIYDRLDSFIERYENISKKYPRLKKYYYDKLVETLIYYKSYFSLEGNRLNELCEKYPELKNSYLSSKVLRYKLKNFSPNVHNPEDVRYFD